MRDVKSCLSWHPISPRVAEYFEIMGSARARKSVGIWRVKRQIYLLELDGVEVGEELF